MGRFKGIVAAAGERIGKHAAALLINPQAGEQTIGFAQMAPPAGIGHRLIGGAGSRPAAISANRVIPSRVRACSSGTTPNPASVIALSSLYLGAYTHCAFAPASDEDSVAAMSAPAPLRPGLWEYAPAPESMRPEIAPRQGHFIGGKWPASKTGRVLPVINPATGQVIQEGWNTQHNADGQLENQFKVSINRDTHEISFDFKGSDAWSNWKSDLGNAGASEFAKIQEQAQRAFEALKNDERYKDYRFAATGQAGLCGAQGLPGRHFASGGRHLLLEPFGRRNRQHEDRIALTGRWPPGHC